MTTELTTKRQGWPPNNALPPCWGPPPIRATFLLSPQPHPQTHTIQDIMPPVFGAVVSANFLPLREIRWQGNGSSNISPCFLSAAFIKSWRTIWTLLYQNGPGRTIQDVKKNIGNTRSCWQYESHQQKVLFVVGHWMIQELLWGSFLTHFYPVTKYTSSCYDITTR